MEAADNQSGNALIFGPATGPKCTEREFTEEGYCWYEIDNKAGCFVLLRGYFISNPNFSAYSVTWSGGCLGDLAHGKGTLHATTHSSFWGLSESKDTGEIVLGNRQGHWISRCTSTPPPDSALSPYSCIEEGQYVDSKKSGKWVWRYSGGSDGEEVGEDQYVDGELVE